MNLKNHILVASPSLGDSRFQKCVVYVAKHDDEGAFGFIINQPLTINMADIFDDLDIMVNHNYKDDLEKTWVLDGGPVSPEVGFILHTGLPVWQSSVAVTENICFTTTKDVLIDIAQTQSSAYYQMCLGYTGWHKDQLEREIKAGSWFSIPATSDLLFNVPLLDRWALANEKAGIHLDWLVDDVIGRA